jgi:hypothetical protein
VCALLTAIAMSAQRRGAALGDGPEDASMLPGDPRVVGVEKAITVLAHDVGHLEGWPRHRLWSRLDRRTVSSPGRTSASNGLATAWR